MTSNNKAFKPVSQCPLLHEVQKLAEDKYKNISIACKHRKCPASSHLKTFELVPDNNLPVNDEIIINWTGNDPAPVPFLETSDGQKVSGPPYKISLDNYSIGTIFPEWYKKNTSQPLEFGAELLKSIFTFNLTRKIGISRLPFGTMDVVLYNPDKWKLDIKFPCPGRKAAKRGTKWETAYGKGGSITTTTSQSSGRETLQTETVTKQSRYEGFTLSEEKVSLQSGNKLETENFRTYTSKSGTGSSSYGDSPKIVSSPNNIITLTKNGVPLTVNGLGIIHFIGQFMKWMQNISEMLKDIPKAGAYCEYEWSMMEGELSLEWGWEEYKPDHRAFYAVKLNLEVTVLDIKLEVGVGASGFSVKFQAFANIEGVLKCNVQFSRTKPSGNNWGIVSDKAGTSHEGPLQAILEGSIIGSVGARFEALYYVKIEAKVSSGIEMKGKLTGFNEEEPFNADMCIQFTGIKGSVTTSVGFADVNGEEQQSRHFQSLPQVGLRTAGEAKSDPKEKEVTFLDEYIIAQFTWPDAFKKYSNTLDEMSDVDIKRAIKEMLNGKFLNSGFFNDKKIRVKQMMTNQEMADENALKKFVKAITLDFDTLKDTEEDKVINNMFEKIKRKEYFDRTGKSVQLFLSKVREHLVPLMEREGEKHNYILWSNYKAYINGKTFFQLMANHTDDSKEFIANNIH